MGGLGALPGGNSTALGVSASAVISAGPAILYQVNVTTDGSTAGALYDCATVAAATTANLIAAVAIPTTVGAISFGGGWRCKVGLVYVPGAGQVASIAYTPYAPL